MILYIFIYLFHASPNVILQERVGDRKTGFYHRLFRKNIILQLIFELRCGLVLSLGNTQSCYDITA